MRLPLLNRLLLACVLLAACGKPPEKTPDPVPTPEEPGTMPVTYRAISGISMGAIGSSMIGLHNPAKFDAIAPLGGPIDWNYMLRYMEKFHLGGFCTRAELEDLMAKNPTNPNVLNDPAKLTCMKKVPGEVPYEHSQSYSYWRYTSSGGSFDRNSYMNLFTDLVLAHGNPFYYNAESPFAPGTTARDASPKGIDPEKLKHPPKDICSNPLRIKKLYNAEYNADGKYDAITFCDGEEDPIYYCQKTLKAVDFCSDGARIIPRSEEKDFAIKYCGTDLLEEASKTHARAIFEQEKGRFDPCREHTRLMPVGLAFDFNGNGRRDYGEPLVGNGHERFDDFGKDGCPSPREDGKGGCVDDPARSPFAGGSKDPNGDDYDSLKNPEGLENNWVRDEGEAYQDDGLDGVPSTFDFGEGDGKYSVSPNRLRMMSLDPRTNYSKLAAEQKKQLDVYLDGGIRDVFNLGVQSKEIFGAVKKGNPAGDTLVVRHFADLPGVPGWDENSYSGSFVKWKEVPRNVLLLYGTEQPTQDDLDNGDGDHVGTTFQAVQRFLTMSSWMSNRWTYPDVKPTVCKADSECEGANPERCFHGACQPSEFALRDKSLSYPSKALGADRDFGIYLPPGYGDPANAETRYPVLYMLHGYGMKASGPSGFVDSSVVIFDVPMSDPEIKARKMIVVFVSGRCCYTDLQTSQRICVEDNPATRDSWDRDPRYERTCNTGNFYADSLGYTGKDGIAYEQSLLELTEYVDAHFRTRRPGVVKVR